MNFTAGADPEVFVGDATSPRSIIGKIGGTKAYPRPLPLGDGFGVQEDNVAMEFTIPPSPDKDSFVRNIGLALSFLETAVKDMYDYKLVKESAISFPTEELQHPMARVFGCDPDYNAWNGRRNPRPSAGDPNLRSAGGHVHIGIDGRLNKTQKRSIIKACDLYLGVPSVLMDGGELRKSLYGKAGAMRFKPYGVEYRTLSNFWIFQPRLTEWVHDNVGRALECKFDLAHERKEIENCINGNDKRIAERLAKKYSLEVL